MSQQTLGDLADLVRSKNAGPFWITFDIMFQTQADYQRVVESGVIHSAWIAETYAVPAADIVLVNLDAARAIKFSFPRQKVQGDLGEMDMYSGQQYAPLLALMV